ncbi:MAG TPA: YciI family protein [Candidatus Sumerlaeota bacterium]|nr:YciI family protein [Candidatus Sumerlaeota bacterium]
MGLYVMLGEDSPEGTARRPDVRPAHLAYWGPMSAQGRVRYAGPLLDAHEKPVGSVIIFEAEDLAAARTLAQGDPYVREGVFGILRCHASKQVLPEG